MIIVLSPSKGQTFDHPASVITHTLPEHLAQSKILIDELRKLKISDLQPLMGVSVKIAALNVERYRNFSIPFTPQNDRQALFAFKGDVYRQIPISSYSKAGHNYTQNHLRILSGLYGTLRPLDLIQPYRLEMKTKLKTERGDNLYQFWDERITDSLNMALGVQKNPTLVNLASNEYFKAVKPKQIKGRLLTINFKEIKKGKARVIAIFAKRARGMMAHYLLKNRIQETEQIKKFNVADYQFSPNDSDEKNWVFVRPQPA